MSAQRGQELWAVTHRGSELHNAPILQMRTQEQVKTFDSKGPQP